MDTDSLLSSIQESLDAPEGQFIKQAEDFEVLSDGKEGNKNLLIKVTIPNSKQAELYQTNFKLVNDIVVMVFKKLNKTPRMQTKLSIVNFLTIEQKLDRQDQYRFVVNIFDNDLILDWSRLWAYGMEANSETKWKVF